MSNKCMGPEKKRACQSIKMWLWKTKNYAWFPIMIKSLIFREFVKTASFVQDSWKEEISFVNSLKLKHTFVIRDSSIDKILFVKLLNPLFLCRSWIRENEKYRSWIRESSPPPREGLIGMEQKKVSRKKRQSWLSKKPRQAATIS